MSPDRQWVALLVIAGINKTIALNPKRSLDHKKVIRKGFTTHFSISNAEF